MALLVQKFGGRCLGTPQRIKSVAAKIVEAKSEGYDVIVVVSAMGSSTDQLMELAMEITSTPSKRELDMLLTAGERVSMALLAIAINSMGWHAISFTGSQSGIITDDGHGEARIVDVKAFRIRDEIERGRVVIVAGFQGVSGSKEVTTLGRGGSDLTAVTLAAAFGAKRCELYKDVAGIHTADPRIVTDAKRIPELSYGELLELIGAGSQVVQDRAVLAARRFCVPLYITSGFERTEGSMVTERPRDGTYPVRGIGLRKDVTLLKIEPVGDLRDAARVLASLAAAKISVYLINSSMGDGGAGKIVLAVDSSHAERALREITDSGTAGARIDKEVGLLSLVGDRVGSPDLASKALEKLSECGVPVEGVSSTSTTLTCITSPEDSEEGVRALHSQIEEKQEK
jgi:aspartate kinase